MGKSRGLFELLGIDVEKIEKKHRARKEKTIRVKPKLIKEINLFKRK